jgi:hypothetical protein
MAAGLPGFGLSGIFFIVSALLMVPIEIVATLRGRSSLARWGTVLRSAGIALAILAGTELTYAALRLALAQLSGSASGAGGSLARSGGRAAHVIHALPILPILGTLGLVAIVTAGAKLAEILSGLRALPVRSDATPTHPRLELHSVGNRRPTPRPLTDPAELRPPSSARSRERAVL